MITEFKSNGVVLDDGSFEEADCVIFCTGYHVNTSFYDQEVLDILNYNPNYEGESYVLYNYTFHPDLPNMAVLNHERRLNTFINIDLQAKLACLVFAGHKQLPDAAVMRQQINEENESRTQRRSGKTSANTRPRIRYTDVMQLLARNIGCEPNENDPDIVRMLR